MSELRDQIRAAMGGEPPAPEPQVETPEVAEIAPEVVEATPEVEGKLSEQPRDEKGKFAPKAAEAAAPEVGDEPKPEEIQAVEPAEKEPPKEAIPIPPSLPAAVKAKWADLDEDVQKAFSKQEESVQTAKAEWSRKGERLNRLEEIIAPHKDAWAVQGLDDHQALTRLVAAEKVLRETPIQGILYLAQTYGVNLHQLMQTSPAASHGQQQTPASFAQPAMSSDPALQAALAEIQDLKAQFAQQTNASAEASKAAVQAQIAKFAADPENLYFENVREAVAQILEMGHAHTLEDAYQRAIWADPEIRPLLIQGQSRQADEAAKAKAAAKQAEADARAKSQAAAKASGSVTGAPTPGATAPRASSTGNLRSDIEAAYQELHAAV